MCEISFFIIIHSISFLSTYLQPFELKFCMHVYLIWSCLKILDEYFIFESYTGWSWWSWKMTIGNALYNDITSLISYLYFVLTGMSPIGIQDLITNRKEAIGIPD